jgi:hypothetical protein
VAVELLPVTVTQVSTGGASAPRTSALAALASAAQQETRSRVTYQVPSASRVTKPVSRTARPRRERPLS